MNQLQFLSDAVHRVKQLLGLRVGVSGHAAYAHKAMGDRGSKHGVCVYALAHQLPEELAYQDFVINNDRDYRRKAVEQLEAERYKFASQKRAQLSKPATALRFSLDYFDRFKDCRCVGGSQRRRIYKRAAVMFYKLDYVSTRRYKSTN